MKSEEQLKEEIARGVDADKWLNHPVYKNVITLMKAELFNQFEQTKTSDKDSLEEIWRKTQALNGVVNRMERMIRDGHNANESLLSKIKQAVKRVA